jgi:hypothetical protein
MARYVNIGLGAWLIASAFLWHHGTAQLTNALVGGIIAMAAGVAALRMPNLRFVLTAVGAWLIVTAFAFPHVSAGTVWNHVLVGVTTFYVSFIGPHTSMAPRTPLQTPA